MENSILTSTKKLLGVAADYTIFDIDIVMHINSAFSTLNQLGVGPEIAFMVEDDSATWDLLDLPINQLSMVKTYIYLKTRLAFDPPITSFAIDALKQQIQEHEVRLNIFSEDVLRPLTIVVEEEEV